MKKTPDYLENPLDNIIYKWCEPISVICRKLKFTPNDITTLSLIFGILAVVFLHKGKTALSIACYFISYIFDSADGYYARKYKMCTKFGDIYDHVKDWIVYISFVSVLVYRNFKKLSRAQWVLVFTFFACLLLLQCIYFAAQGKYQDNVSETPCLGWLNKFIKTKEDAENMLKLFRFFGPGTFIIATMIFTLSIEKLK